MVPCRTLVLLPLALVAVQTQTRGALASAAGLVVRSQPASATTVAAAGTFELAELAIGELAVNSRTIPAPSEHLRQRIHAFPATYHSQDASGVVYKGGRWHVMPDCGGGYAPNYGLSWCHLSSEDLVHWTEHATVLTPSDDPKVDPCLPTAIDTGSVSLLPDGRAFAVYATVNATNNPTNFDGNLCAAVSTDANLTAPWTRLGAIINNPTCARCQANCSSCTPLKTTCTEAPPPPGCKSPIPRMIPRFGFRDPTTPYLDKCDGPTGTCWYLVMGSGTEVNRSAAGLLYRSRSEHDITSEWTFVSVLIQDTSGHISEQYQYSCPDFFKIGKQWVWMSLLGQGLPDGLSNNDAEWANIYFVGTKSKENRFVPSALTPLTPPYQRFGHTIAKSGGQLGNAGRRLLFGAVCGIFSHGPGIPNPPSSQADAAKNHVGCSMGLGQELTLRTDGGLAFNFLPELAALRSEGAYHARHVAPGLVPTHGRTLEIKVTWPAQRIGVSAPLGLDVLGLVQIRATATLLRVQANCTGTKSECPAGLPPLNTSVPLALSEGEALHMHIYVDGSVVEIIANSRYPLSAIVIPGLADGDAVRLVGGRADTLDVWPLKSIYPGY